MALFRYKAVTETGDVVEGDLEAPTQAAVIAHLRSQGQLPIRADEQRRGPLAGWLGRDLRRSGRLGRADQTRLLQDLSMLLRAGLPIDQALETSGTYAEKASVKALVKRLLDKVRSGIALADAMAAEGGAFDRFTVGMTRAGEASGALDTVLAKTGDFLERTHKSVQNLRSALLYPAILLTATVISVGIIVTVVIPSFQEIFNEAGFPLPLATRVVMAIGSLAQQFWWVPLLAGLGFVLWVVRARKTEAGRLRWDRRILKLPLIGDLLVKAQAARVSFTLGTLLSNGVPLLSALGVARETLANTVLNQAFEAVQKQVKEGKSFARPLDEARVLPKLATHLLRIGEESGRLEDMLFRVADTYEVEVQRSIQRLLTLLVPAITIVMALLISGIIVSILLPMMSINQLAM
ncbi:MAG: type II secretion system F family protein [Rhodospirillales bacterium]